MHLRSTAGSLSAAPRRATRSTPGTRYGSGGAHARAGVRPGRGRQRRGPRPGRRVGHPGSVRAGRHDAGAADVHEEDGGRPGRQGPHRPPQERDREPAGGRRRVWPAGRGHHRHRARAAPPRRPDRRDPRGRRAHQGDRRRRHHGHHQRRRPRHQRSSGGGHRGLVRRNHLCSGAALPGRRDPGRAVAAQPRRDPRGRGRVRHRGHPPDLRHRRPGAGGIRWWSAPASANSDLLRGVRYFADGARTQSIVLCSRCNRVRFVDSIHLFSAARHEEIRL